MTIMNRTGLVFSHSLVNYGVVNLLMDYLTDSWTNQHFAKATAIINLQDGVSTISEVIVAHLADSYYGRFNMIVICAITYITVSLRPALV
uniref:Uncharacterized protein n=1 Tax=Quercus lobata TaxID=97700 RepID=A0A7N2LCU8_QUELO